MARRSAFLSLLFLSNIAVAAPGLTGRSILIDPGHGVIDYQGRVINTGKRASDGIPEYKLTFEIAQRLGKLLEKEGIRVNYTRTAFDYWRQAYNPQEDNRARAYLANELNVDAYIAIHCDWDPRSRIHGVTTFYTKKESKRLGELVQQNLIKELKASSRGLVKDTYTVLDHTEMPAILVETGFLSNRAEGRKLKTADYQQRVAQAMADALRAYFTE